MKELIDNNSMDEVHADDWWGYDLTDPIIFTRAVRKLVHISRGTLEYNVWQSRTKMGKIKMGCPVCKISYDYVEPETHHYPKTMFTVVADIIQEHIDKNDLNDYEPLDLIQKIMRKHMANRVDHIVLCEPCHKKFHKDDPDVISKIWDIWEIYLAELKKNADARLEMIEKTKKNAVIGNLDEISSNEGEIQNEECRNN